MGLSQISVDTHPDAVINLIKRAVGLSYIFSPLYKSDKFKDEKEWRIVYSMYLGDMEKGVIPGILNHENILADTLTLEKYAFAPKGNALVSHLELGLPQLKQTIHSITIGPKSDLTLTDIKLYLISLGLLESFNDSSIKVQRSTISYR